MQDLNNVLRQAKDKKGFENLTEFQTVLSYLEQSDVDMNLDWDKEAGEEWARFSKEKIGCVCMMNTKIGIVFIRKDTIKASSSKILKTLFVVEVANFTSEDWFVDLSILHKTTPEINWHASPNAVNIDKMSLNDLYYATV